MKPRQTLLLVLFLLVIAPVILWLLSSPDWSDTLSFIYSLSRLGALLGFTLFGVQIGLSAKLRFIERYFGHDKMITIHRRLGIAAFILVLFHALAVIVMRATAFLSFKTELLLGIIALSLLVILLLFILSRKYLHSRYEYWAIVHQLNYLIFLLAFVHSIFIGTTLRSSLIWQIFWVLLGFGFIGIAGYKLWNNYRVHRNRFQVAQVVQETPTIWTIHFQPQKLDYRPGQFMILRLIHNAVTSEPHPFTIASSPSSPALSVSIKAAGDFTGKIGTTKPGDYALIDAPYGRFSFLEFPGESYLFIAGGIGITPFMSMLRFMRDKRITKKVLLLWGNRTEADIAFRDELRQMEQTMASLKVVHILSEKNDWNGETGFISAPLIKKYAGDLAGIEIFICGPPIMMKLVLNTLQSLNVSKSKIHFERFTW
jgi:predicted ferric reductase